MKNRLNLDYEESILQLSRAKRWLPTRVFRTIIDRIVNWGRMDGEVVQIIKEEKNKHEGTKRR